MSAVNIRNMAAIELYLLLFAANVPFHLFYGRIFFGGWRGFFRTVLDLFGTTDVYELVHAREKANYAIMKILIYLGACFVTVLIEYRILIHWLGFTPPLLPQG